MHRPERQDGLNVLICVTPGHLERKRSGKTFDLSLILSSKIKSELDIHPTRSSVVLELLCKSQLRPAVPGWSFLILRIITPLCKANTPKYDARADNTWILSRDRPRVCTLSTSASRCSVAQQKRKFEANLMQIQV